MTTETQFLFVFVYEEDGFLMVDKLVHHVVRLVGSVPVDAHVLHMLGFISKLEEHGHDKITCTYAFRTCTCLNFVSMREGERKSTTYK